MSTALAVALSCILLLCQCDLNQWNTTTGPNDEDIWYSTSDFVPVQSQSFGTIKIGRIMTMEFDFIFGGRTSDPNRNAHEMFFRVGYDSSGGTSCDAQNSRYPSLWLSSDTETLYVSASDGTGCSNFYFLDEFGSITIGMSYHILITFNDTVLFVAISVDGESSLWTQQWTRLSTVSSHLGDRVPIWWMSGKFGPSRYNRANGTFSNISLISKWFSYDDGLKPSPSPTNEPSTTPISTLSPSESDDGKDTVFPTWSPSEAPSIYPVMSASTPIPFDDSNQELISPPTQISPSPTARIDVNVEGESSASVSSAYSIPAVYFLIAGATAFSLCFLCLGLMAFIWVRCKRINSQIHDVRRHIHRLNTARVQKKEAVPSHSNVEIFYSPVSSAPELEIGSLSQRTHTPHNTLFSIPVTIPLHSPLWIGNVLAVVICIAEYDDIPKGGNSLSTDDMDYEPSPMTDMKGIEKDWFNLMAFFEYLNYPVIPGEKRYKLRWTEQRLVDFLRNDVGKALFGGTDADELQYDALIVCISCHGLRDTVITSDLKLIEKEALHRLVSLYHPKVREIPRLFVIDACDGPEGRATVGMRASNLQLAPHMHSLPKLPMSVLSLSVKKGDSDLLCTLSRRRGTVNTVSKGTNFNINALTQGETVQQWTTNTTNPDYNLAVIYAANTGFEAKTREDIGSYFIALFIDKIKENIQRKQGKRLADICHEIQEHLHNEGKQLPKPVFYGDTRNIMFRVNKSGVTIGVSP